MQGFMQGLWIYPEDTEVLGVACKSLLKALKSRYQKIALFSPIRPYDGGCEGFGECEGLNPLKFHSAIDKQKALELVSAAQEELLFETILKRYDGLQTTHNFVINLGYAPKFFLNALLDLNTTLAKHLNAPVVAVAQTSLERLKAMYFHILKKEAPFAVGLFAGEMLEKPNFLSASLCKGELEADLIESVLQTKSKITTPLAFQMSLEKKAKKQIKKVVLPESEDERILKAAHRLNAMGAVGLILLGDKEAINSQAKNLNLNLENVEIIDPNTSHYREEFANNLYELRKSKGLSEQEAKQLVLDKTYFATMLVHSGYAHAMVSGVNHTTADTIRPALQIIKTKPGVSLVSSVFLMCLDTQVLVFGDCAIIPNPSPKELAEIAITSAKSAKQFNIVPKVALLSYATGDSAQGEMIDKINEAREIAQRLDPQLEIDGPLQFDASIDKSVAKKKMPNSQVAGQASVFIFPDLNAGNIAYQKSKSVDTSMGLTPLEGLIMGTRCGDIDPTVVEYIAQCANKSLEEVMKILNHESCLKGICGDNDARNIEARKEKGDKQAKLAFEMCAYRVKKHIGAYMVALGRVDAIIFTGGLGENYSALRESVCEGLENLGIALNKPTNDNPGNGLVDLSQPDSKVKVLRIPTDEELEIALQAKEIVEKLK
ncbi:phosphate acetyltransferase [Helicobacter pylori]|uniref:phosphate acetyltransferase n=1 Tax=Helicobacter pylori TaxID=210 RepID=UPI001E409D8F|nr:phosphate acetyltransferase [Helicobacter pylori]